MEGQARELLVIDNSSLLSFFKIPSHLSELYESVIILSPEAFQ